MLVHRVSWKALQQQQCQLLLSCLCSINNEPCCRVKHERLAQRVAQPERLATRHGSFMVHTYRSLLDGGQHLALVHGNISDKQQVSWQT